MKSGDDPHHWRLLYDLGCAFAERVEIDELIPLVLTKCCEVLEADAASLLLLDATTQELYFPYVTEVLPDVAARLRDLRFPAHRGIAGDVLRTGLAQRVEDVAADPRFYGEIDNQTGVTTHSMLVAALKSRPGIIGVIEIVNPRHGAVFTADDDDLGLLTALAGSIAVAVDNARLYAQLKGQVRILEEAVRAREQLSALRHELDAAAIIQQSLLARTFPAFPERHDVDVFATMVPAEEVGGDFYDFFFIDADHLGLVIGDVSGKGIPAAIFMAMSRTLLKATALRGEPPAACLQHVNMLLCRDNQAELFVSVVYGILETRTGELEYSTAGHRPPYVLRSSGGVAQLDATGTTVLGILENVDVASRRASLAPGDRLILYTGGVTNAMNAQGTSFSDTQLRAVLERQAGKSPEAIVRSVIEHVAQHASGTPPADDITLLCVARPLLPG